MADSVDGVDVYLRRSGRKRRANWRETLQLSVRASRARAGDDEKIAVRSLGGKPSHKKKDNQQSKPVVRKRLQFCGNCGHKHSSETANFCCACGKKRPANAITAITPASSSATSSATENSATAITCTTTNSEIQSTANSATATTLATENSATATSAKTTTQNPRGRPAKVCKKKILQCGWIAVDDGFVAPDGKKFSTRKKASLYFNNNIPKLEPARKDGWQVFVDSSKTHSNWIAPDGEVLKSFLAAKSYASKSNLELFGKDGITTSIASFFASKSMKQHGTTLTTLQKQVPHAVMPKTIAVFDQEPPVKKAKKTSKPRPFTIPPQSEDGSELQCMCKRAAVWRLRNNVAKAEVVATEYTKAFTKKRIISQNMTCKVCVYLSNV